MKVKPQFLEYELFFHFFPIKIKITVKIGQFILWKNCCCKKPPKPETFIRKRIIQDIATDSEIEVNKSGKTDAKLAKKVHFNNVQEVIIIPARSTSERIWKPLGSRINFILHNFVHFLCYPCILLIQIFSKESGPPFGGPTQNHGPSENASANP